MGEYVGCLDPCGSTACAQYGCFTAALTEEAHGRVGDTEGVAEVTCQRIHGMSKAEYDALPPHSGDWDD